MKGNPCNKQGEESARKQEGQGLGLRAAASVACHRRPCGHGVMGGACQVRSSRAEASTGQGTRGWGCLTEQSVLF